MLGHKWGKGHPLLVEVKYGKHYMGGGTGLGFVDTPP